MINPMIALYVLGYVLAAWLLYIGIRAYFSYKVCRTVFAEKIKAGTLIVDTDFNAFASAWWAHNGPRKHVFMFGAALGSVGAWWMIFEYVWAPVQDMFYGIDSIQNIQGIDAYALYNILIIITAFLFIVISTGFVVYVAMRLFYQTMPPPLSRFDKRET